MICKGSYRIPYGLGELYEAEGGNMVADVLDEQVDYTVINDDRTEQREVIKTGKRALAMPAIA